MRFLGAIISSYLHFLSALLNDVHVVGQGVAFRREALSKFTQTEDTQSNTCIRRMEYFSRTNRSLEGCQECCRKGNARRSAEITLPHMLHLLRYTSLRATKCCGRRPQMSRHHRYAAACMMEYCCLASQAFRTVPIPTPHSPPLKHSQQQ